MKLIITIIMLTAISGGLVQGEEPSVEARCKQLSDKYVDKQKQIGIDYTLISVRSFYSKKMDSCIHLENKVVGVKIVLKDLSQSILVDGPQFYHSLLYCDRDGADSAKLEAVHHYRGEIDHVPYKEWLDDGNGGQPRALVKPKNPYTKTQCNKVLQKWLSILE